MGLEPGYQVSKHLRLVRMVGRGGMGSVWIADHLALKTHVAVKFMSGVYVHDPALVTRFEREATSAAQIKSPHIVQVHDHGMSGDGIPYIVMELLDGEDLSTRLKREGPLPPRDVATILMQMCKALNQAHKLGIIHRDIKPGNVFLLDADGDIFVKLLDFGIAKPGKGESSDVTSTGAIVGTVVYMSPEQLLNAKHVDFRADLWSAAVVTYRAMTGFLPFSDEDGLGSLCMAFEQNLFKLPSEHDPSIPAAVDAWFKKAFQRKPENRFESAKEMVRAFFHAIGESPAVLERHRITSSKVESPTQDSQFSEAWEPNSMRTLEGIGPQGAPSSRTAGPDDPTTHDSQASDRLSASLPGKTAETPKSAEPITAGTAAPMTVDGTAASSSQHRAKRKGWVVPVVLVGALLAGGALLGLQYLNNLNKSPIQPSELQPVDVPSAAPEVSASPVVSSLPSAEPTVAPEIMPSSQVQAPTATDHPAVSAAPPAASSQKTIPLRPTGTQKNPAPEKDYGF